MPASGGSVSDAPVNKVVDGKSHYLAYITPDEGKSLVDQGGQEVVTDSGIPAYPPPGERGGGGYDAPSSPESTSGGGGGGGPPGGGDPGMRSAPAPTGPTMGDVAGPTYTEPTNVDAEDEYLAPDKEHWNQTQKEINTKIREAKKDDRYDVSLTPEQSEQYQTDMNEYYGTEGKRYEEYGRAGKGTVNLSFQEHWKNAPIVQPALKYSPTARLLYAAGKNAAEWLTSDYGTSRYGAQPGTGSGPPVDQGGILGRASGLLSGDTPDERGAMNILSPSAPYIVSGTTMPTNSPAANWYQNLGLTSTNPLGHSLATEYAAAKQNIKNTLGTPSSLGWLAVNDSPFYNWLKENSLDKGIL